MLAKLVLLFLLIPLADLALLLYLATKIGWATALVLAVVSGILGAWMLRQSLLGTLRRLQEPTLTAESPLELLSDGAMISLAAGLLLTPGLVTDIAGISLLIPACRRSYRKILAAWLKRNWKVAYHYTFSDRRGDSSRWNDTSEILDGEVQSATEDPLDGLPRSNLRSTQREPKHRLT
jgi:UPF0716 protein FxsA